MKRIKNDFSRTKRFKGSPLTRDVVLTNHTSRLTSVEGDFWWGLYLN